MEWGKKQNPINILGVFLLTLFVKLDHLSVVGKIVYINELVYITKSVSKITRKKFYKTGS